MKNKNILITVCSVFSASIITWTVFFFLFPVMIIDGVEYNKNKILNISRQRDADYNNLFISLRNELEEIIKKQIITPLYSKQLSDQRQFDADIQNILETFYAKSILIDEKYFHLMNESINKINFPVQRTDEYFLPGIFPPYIGVIKYGDKYYNEFAVNLFLKNYEEIVKKTIKEKTSIYINYIDYNLGNSEINTLENHGDNIKINGNIFNYLLKQCLIEEKYIERMNTSITEINDFSFFNVCAAEINGTTYSLTAVNELQESMEIVSEYLLSRVKDIFAYHINHQTEIYSNNINEYINWYYSVNTGIERTLTNIVGFFSGERSPEETFYINNFNRIMNNNSDFNQIVHSDMSVIRNITSELFNGYFEVLKYFPEDSAQTIPVNTLTEEMYIGPFSNKIVVYFENVFETLDSAGGFLYQDYVTNNKIVNLRQQLFIRMIENQNNKIEIINDPAKVIMDRLVPGSALYVDNYFAGFSTYQHYGVYIGNGRVVHFAPFEGQEISFENGIIHETTLEKFLDGRALKIDMNIERAFSQEEIIQRARSRIGEKQYDLFLNNCEHFARWCITGESVSNQVINIPQKLDDTILTIRDGINNISRFFDLFR